MFILLLLSCVLYCNHKRTINCNVLDFIILNHKNIIIIKFNFKKRDVTYQLSNNVYAYYTYNIILLYMVGGIVCHARSMCLVPHTAALCSLLVYIICKPRTFQ